MTHSSTEQPAINELCQWFNEGDGFKQGTAAPHKWVLQANSEISRQHARIEELEKDAARLLYATKDYDGFVHVERDKYDFILECMEEDGRSEPTDEDELNGVRRLIDAAIAAQAKQGGAA